MARAIRATRPGCAAGVRAYAARVSTADPSARRRADGIGRGIGRGIAAAVLGGTAASVVFNRLTRPPERLAPESGAFVRVGASDVHYEQWGDDGPPVVLVPGSLESSVVWSTVGPLLGRRHRVFAPDMPWLGYTRYEGPRDLAGQGDLLAGFVAALGLDRPLLVGHSLGAGVVADVALRHPQVTRGVVFADGDALPIDTVPHWLGAAVLRLPHVTSAVRLAVRLPRLVRPLIESQRGPAGPPVSMRLTEQWLRPLGQRVGEEALRRFMDTTVYGLRPDQLRAITVPAAIVWGGHDHALVSLHDTIVNLRRPPVRIIPGAGHLAMLADPEAFADAVAASLPWTEAAARHSGPR